MANTDWSRDEVELIVADYFAMLEAEKALQPVNKAEHNRRLQAVLNDRSKGAIEFKHANISAVLALDDLPYIDGYKPRGNYQALLEQVVLERLATEPDFFERLANSPAVRSESVGATDYTKLDELIEAPPDPFGESGIHLVARESNRGIKAARKVDFARIDAQNRTLGRLGEEWTLEFERRRLHDVEKRADLARKIVWISQEEGDGAGFDIRSFNADESPRLIEVKATGLGKYLPFYVTPNELETSERRPSEYHLYRVFEFATDPRVYMLRGALSSSCHLRPSQYAARVGRS